MQPYPNEWKVLLHSSITCLKTILLHLGNIYPSVSIGYAVFTRETYDNLEVLLRNDGDNSRKMCADINILEVSEN